MAEKPFKVKSFSNAAGGGSEATSVQHLLVSNSSTTIDSTALSTLSSIEYVIEIEQGTKRRVSNVSLRTDGTNVSITEYGVAEVGGSLTGFALASSVSGGNALLNITITDAETTNAFIDMDKVVKNKVLSPYGISTATATDVGTSRAYNNGAASVAFTAASFGEAPTAYTVTSVSDATLTASGSSSPIVVTGLASASTHSFSVTPSNANGIGPARTTGSITATTVPQAPTIGTATTPSETSAVVTFTAPSNTGGSPITGFTVTSSPGSFTATGASSPLTITGMSTNTYTFTAVATNANGNSLASAATSALYVGPVAGAAWTQRTTFDGQTKNGSMAYGNGRFVHIRHAIGNGVRVSTNNGVTFTSNGSITDPVSLAYGNGYFVGYRFAGQIQRSTDGTTWTTSLSTAAANFTSAFFCNLASSGAGQWLLTDGQNASRHMISDDDGATWTTISPSGITATNFGRVTYGNSLWVATSGGNVYTSTNRTSWTNRGSVYSYNYHGLAYGNGVFVVHDGNGNNFKTSTDGITWTSRAGFGAGYSEPGTIAYGGGMWVIGQNSSQVWTSGDGITWVSRSAFPGSNTIKAMAASPAGQFLAVGDTVSYTSPA